MWTLFIIPIILFITAIFGLPSYIFYEILRIVVAIQSLIYALLFFLGESYNLKAASVVFVVIACIFFKLTMSRSEWQVTDIIVALLFIAANIYMIKNDKSESSLKLRNRFKFFTFRNIAIIIIFVLIITNFITFALYKYQYDLNKRITSPYFKYSINQTIPAQPNNIFTEIRISLSHLF